MRTCKELTKERLIELGITHVTDDGRIFKGDYEIKQGIASKKGKYKEQAKYARISLSDKTKKVYNPKYGDNWYSYGNILVTAHRVIYAWHYDIVPAGFDVDHIDENTLNNHISNLRLLTRQENNRRKCYSRNQYTYNLTDAEIEEKRKALKWTYNRDLHKPVKAEWWEKEQAQRRFNKTEKKRATEQWHKLVADRNDLINKRKQAKLLNDINKWRELGVLIDEINVKIIMVKKKYKIREYK